MNKFIVNEIEYCIVRNPYTGGPMIASMVTWWLWIDK